MKHNWPAIPFTIYKTHTIDIMNQLRTFLEIDLHKRLTNNYIR